MTKGIIAVDMPETCNMCRFFRSYAGLTQDCGFYNLPINSSAKPYWCPIKSIPEKISKNKVSAIEQIQEEIIVCKKMISDYRKNSKEQNLLEGMIIAYKRMIELIEKGEIE